jgi:hypothetical protein
VADAENVFPYNLAPSAELPPTAVPDVREMLAEMESGNVTGFVFVIKSNGYTRHWTWSAVTNADAINLLGQLEYVKSRIVADIERRT